MNHPTNLLQQTSRSAHTQYKIYSTLTLFDAALPQGKQHTHAQSEINSTTIFLITTAGNFTGPYKYKQIAT